MTIKITTYDGKDILCECDSFEFRTNQVSNWIKIKKRYNNQCYTWNFYNQNQIRRRQYEKVNNRRT